MLHVLSGLTPHLLPLAATSSFALAGIILGLCVFAGIGTALLLPGSHETSLRAIGGAIVLAAGLISLALLLHFSANHAPHGVDVYFWLFSAIAVAGAVRVVTHPRPVYSALYFVLTVMASAGLFILLQAEFMAAALVIIYAGAILVTYVFVIMLASQTVVGVDPKSSGSLAALAEYDRVSREPLVASAVGFALMGALLFVIFDKPVTVVKEEGTVTPFANTTGVKIEGNTQQLGEYLFTNQSVNLELAGIILTVSMVGAIVIARRRVDGEELSGADEEVVLAAATPVDDDPHSIPVYGTDNPRQKAYPET